MASSAATMGSGDAAPLGGVVISVCRNLPYLITVEGGSLNIDQASDTALMHSLLHLTSPECPSGHALVVGINKIKRVTATSTEDSFLISPEECKHLEHDLSKHLPDRVCIVRPTDGTDRDSSVSLQAHEKQNRFAEEIIAPLFRNERPETFDEAALKQAWTDYERLNKDFSDSILHLYRPGDLVVIHDYQLLLVPGLLRQKVPGMYIGLILHASLPSTENWTKLYLNGDILRGMLGADMIEFIEPDHIASFEAACAKQLNIHAAKHVVDFNGAYVKLEHATTRDNVRDWTTKYTKNFVGHIETCNRARSTPVLSMSGMLERYASSGGRLIMLDYDGTLTSIVANADLATPTEHTLSTLHKLTLDPCNAVWIISGRNQAFLEAHLGSIAGLGLSAEHGCFVRVPNSAEWENLAAKLDMTWKDVVAEIFNDYTKRTPGSMIEWKAVGVTWHYRNALEQAQAAEHAESCKKDLLEQVAKNYGVDIMAGKMNVEVRPRFINKGEIVRRLLAGYGDGDGAELEFVFCAGDDTTDEDMFMKLLCSKLPQDSIFTVKVGRAEQQTLAHWHVNEPEAVVEALAMLHN